MSSTHSANPMVCAAGKANLEALLEDGLIENSRQLGEVLHAGLEDLRASHPSHIGSVQGKGLLAGVLFTAPDGKPLSTLCDRIAERCMQRGLLVVHTGRESIKLAPPLCITRDGLSEGLEVFSGAVSDCIGEEAG